MKTLKRFGLALLGASILFTALVALGIASVLGVGMAAAACDFQPTGPAATTGDMATSAQPVPFEDFEPPVSWSPPTTDFAFAIDYDSSTTETLPPGSVPML